MQLAKYLGSSSKLKSIIPDPSIKFQLKDLVAKEVIHKIKSLELEILQINESSVTFILPDRNAWFDLHTRPILVKLTWSDELCMVQIEFPTLKKVVVYGFLILILIFAINNILINPFQTIFMFFFLFGISHLVSFSMITGSSTRVRERLNVILEEI